MEHDLDLCWRGNGIELKKFLTITFSDMTANYDLKVALHFVHNKESKLNMLGSLFNVINVNCKTLGDWESEVEGKWNKRG